MDSLHPNSDIVFFVSLEDVIRNGPESDVRNHDTSLLLRFPNRTGFRSLTIVQVTPRSGPRAVTMNTLPANQQDFIIASYQDPDTDLGPSFHEPSLSKNGSGGVSVVLFM
jgi:hypothetical protein